MARPTDGYTCKRLFYFCFIMALHSAENKRDRLRFHRSQRVPYIYSYLYLQSVAINI